MSLNIAISVDPEIPVPPVFYGGIERIADGLAEELARRGHRVTLLASPSSRAPVEVVGLPGRSSLSRLDTLKNMAVVTNTMARRRCDVIHSFSRLAYLLPLMRATVPKIMTYQRAITERSVRLGAAMAGGSLKFTAVSKAMIKPLANHVDWHVVPNFVNTDNFVMTEKPGDSAPLLFIGRIEAIKGVHHAIDVAERVGRDLVIAGNVSAAPGASAYFDECVRPRLGATVHYAGPVNDRDKITLLNRAAALLMPITWDEPFGIVMAEALACGTPVLALNRGSVPEIVRHGVNGFICDDIDAMAAAVHQLDSIDRNACRDSALEHFSHHVVVDRYEAIYDQALASACA